MALSNLRAKLNPWIPESHAAMLDHHCNETLPVLGYDNYGETHWTGLGSGPSWKSIHHEETAFMFNRSHHAPHKICVCIYIYKNMNYICICKSIYMYIHIIYLQHPPVLNLCLLAKSTKCQPLKIKNTPGSFLEPEKCTWKIIPGSYPSSFIPSCDSNATTVGYCWCLLLASNQRLKSMHDMPVWDEQVARMVWKRANKAA